MLKCRADPGTGRVITEFWPGESVPVTGEAQDGWYPVICENEAGWASEQFLTLDRGGESTTVDQLLTDARNPEGQDDALPQVTDTGAGAATEPPPTILPEPTDTSE
jgi:hypothetical protein